MQKREDLTPGESGFEYELARAVYHWVNYVNACGNPKLIEEHSIRYPLAEYMERKCRFNVKLEMGIKSLKRKRYDFFYEYGNKEEGDYSNGYIEVKLLKNETKYNTEVSRYFNDLIRLAISGGKANYFIVFGKRKYLSPSFMHIGQSEDNKTFVKARFSGENIPPYGIFSKWFQFKIGEEIVFCTDAFPELKHKFSESHHDEQDVPIVVDDVNIYTQLKAVMPTGDEQSSYVVYIWKVKLV